MFQTKTNILSFKNEYIILNTLVNVYLLLTIRKLSLHKQGSNN